MAQDTRTLTRPRPDDLTSSPAFKAWFRGSVVRNRDGTPKPVYHGSTHSFEAFSLGPANPENWYGRALYFTDSPEDVGRNYATPDSPDLRVRIDKRTEQLMDRLVDELEQELGEGILWDDPRRRELEEDARSQAARELTGPGALTYKLYLRIERPVVVRHGGGTYFEINYNERTGKETGSGTRLYRSLMKAAGQLGLDGQQIWKESVGEEFDGFNAQQFEDRLRSSDAMLYARNDYNGMNEGEFLSRVYRLAGFDGIVMEDAAATFLNMGILSGTGHYIVWNPRQVKSALGNVGTWSTRSPRMTAGARQATIPGHKMTSAARTRARTAAQGPRQGDPWFSGSHARVLPVSSREPVPETPLTVYHGTDKEFGSFQTGRETVNDWGVFGPIATRRHAIFFAENPEYARTFARARGGNTVVAAHLSVRNPFYMDNESLSDDYGKAAEAYDEARRGGDEEAVRQAREGFQRARWLYNLRDKWEVFDGDEGKAFVQGLRDTGHDGAFFEEEGHGLGPDAGPQRVWAVFDPSQIRKAGAEKEEWPPWIGVDLDGTFAEEQEPFDPLTIGKPIAAMVSKIKAAIEDGVEVRIFTARLADKRLRDQIKEKIKEYTKECIGKELESTNEKDPGMKELWDDRAKRVVKNEGKFASPVRGELYHGTPAENVYYIRKPQKIAAVEKWNEKNVVAHVGSYRITVDDPSEADYISAWTEDNQCVGHLYTRRQSSFTALKDYLSISVVKVKEKHRGYGLGKAMYFALMQYMGPQWKGIKSYLPERYNKKRVPAIWRALGGHMWPDNPDWMVADRQDVPKLASSYPTPEGVDIGTTHHPSHAARFLREEEWRPGEEAWFEYHCTESPDSCDANLWYHSHQRVTVVGREQADGWHKGWDGSTMRERGEAGAPRAYRVRFRDGLEHTAGEDELMTSRRGFYRPDPPIPG